MEVFEDVSGDRTMVIILLTSHFPSDEVDLTVIFRWRGGGGGVRGGDATKQELVCT